MRRYYVVPKSVIYDPVDGMDCNHHDLFVSTGGAHYVDLDGTHILLCCGEFKRPDHEAAWHRHPEVARLHHGASKAALSELLHPANAHKQFADRHLTALARIGVKEQHTVKDVSDIASKLHPLMSLGENY